MDLATIIKEYIEANNITGREFHRRCGKISYAYIANIINGKNYSTGKPPRVHDDKLAAIAQGLGISLNDLKKQMGMHVPVKIIDIKPEDLSGTLVDERKQPDNQIGANHQLPISDSATNSIRKWKLLSAGILTLTDEQLDKIYDMAHILYPEKFPQERTEEK